MREHRGRAFALLGRKIYRLNAALAHACAALALNPNDQLARQLQASLR
jgi:hypothetical protein